MTLRHYIFIAITFAAQYSFSQHFDYELIWGDPFSSQSSSTEFTLYLENGFIDYENGNQPTFSCMIPISKNYNNAVIENLLPESSLLSSIEKKASKDISNIKSGVKYKLNIVTVNRRKYVSLKFPAVFLFKGTLKKLTKISFDLNTQRNNYSGQPRISSEIEKGITISEGNWFKFAITQTGPQKLTYNDLTKNNILNGSINSDYIKLYGNESDMLPYKNEAERHGSLKEMNIEVIDGGDESFDPGDYLIFYGQAGNHTHYNSTSKTLYNRPQYYSDSNFVFLTINSLSPKRISTKDNRSMTTDQTITKFHSLHHHENEWNNFIKSGRIWVGEDFQSQNPLEFNAPIKAEGTASITVNVCARSRTYTNNKVSVIVNQDTIGEILFPIVSTIYHNDYVKFTTKTFSFTPSSETNKVALYYHVPEDAALAWLDYYSINYSGPLSYTQYEYLTIFNKDAANTPGKLSFSFTNSADSLKIWNISNYNDVQAITGQQLGLNYSFNANTINGAQFIAFDNTSYKTPSFIKLCEGQELNYSDIPAMIIISPAAFVKEAQRLADFHTQQDQLKTRVVKAEHIYNHKSSGRKEATAIRDYIKYLYDHPSGGDSLKYVLLFGSGTYDPKNRLDNNKDFIPTYQSENSIKLTASYVTDDFYGVLDDNEGEFKNNDQLDVSVGRIPVKSIQEAKIAVDKIKQYYNFYSTAQDNGKAFSSKGSWQNNILFIADDGDINEHMRQAETLSDIVDTSLSHLNISKIYVDAFVKEVAASGTTVKSANQALRQKIEEGSLIVNYTGHGGEYGWGSERFLDVKGIQNLNNKTALPLVVTATCEFSRFDDPALKSAGEYLFLKENGGAIALFTTVRLVFSIPNFNLNKNFYKVLQEEEEKNTKLRIGDLFRKTKIENNAGTNDRNFTLLGDPALVIAIPEKTIIVDSIVAWNKSTIDTLKSLTQGVISGHIKSKNGTLDNNFNGTIEIKIFDKQIENKTLDNSNSNSAFNYKTQSSLLFKTLAEVKNGKYSTDIILPKNMLSNFDYGKISLYATSSKNDAKGADKSYMIGGADSLGRKDDQGPEINLYLNDSSFIFGDLVAPSPYVIAKLSDESGINITSNNITHNIVLSLNKSPETEFNLNHLYQTDLNTYKSGSVSYQLKDFTEGSHRLEFYASDNHNNRSQHYTEFIIAQDAELALKHVLNYPNPFTTKTGFYFEQNQIKSSIDVVIQIFTISGKIVKTISTNLLTNEQRIGPIEWDGKDDYGDQIGRGIYLYKIQVTAENGSKAEEIQKLVILK